MIAVNVDILIWKCNINYILHMLISCLLSYLVMLKCKRLKEIYNETMTG